MAKIMETNSIVVKNYKECCVFVKYNTVDDQTYCQQKLSNAYVYAVSAKLP